MCSFITHFFVFLQRIHREELPHTEAVQPTVPNLSSREKWCPSTYLREIWWVLNLQNCILLKYIGLKFSSHDLQKASCVYFREKYSLYIESALWGITLIKWVLKEANVLRNKSLFKIVIGLPSRYIKLDSGFSHFCLWKSNTQKNPSWHKHCSLAVWKKTCNLKTSFMVEF